MAMDTGAHQGDESRGLPQVTITLTRYAESDELISRAIRHALAQEGVEGEVLFIEQDVEKPLDATRFEAGNLAFRMIARKLGGLSDARNLALDEARYPLVLYLDADAMAEPDWASRLAEVLRSDPKVAVAGSRIVPGWPGKPPVWARARVVSDQYSMLDLGSETKPWHRVVGAAFGLDMAKLGPDMRFDPTLGRREGKLFSGEESEFCARVVERGFEIRYVGSAVVTHEVSRERTRLLWVMRRLYYAGLGRSQVGGAPAPSRRPGLADWLTLPLILPPYALGWARGKLAGSRKV
ncbi:glycosyltransferase [Qipengyuania sp. 1NDH17]|uniref:Glycosyltransferase n=1 Tax=Qipengyuania polymorpha TaxID=2867234 RepID=A0ABS7IZD9_9SPHN|nr:glycosyltransferase [Qipengyuania polymorpha]MBX7457695.1 glycosyltransferase [Qipengyuania polymorpha]